MSTETSIENIRRALAANAFNDGLVRLADADLNGFTHLVASRDGLFSVKQDGFKIILHGFFFGLTIHGDHIYLFESSGRPSNLESAGRIIRLTRQGHRIIEAAELTRGLDQGCHQIDFFDGALHVVDTYRQNVLRYSSFDREPDVLSPLVPVPASHWNEGYAHINSILKARNGILLLLHNGGRNTGRPSELVLLDEAWREIDRRMLPASGAHNIAVLEDGTVLSCASDSGELIVLNGQRHPVSPMMTRGLSVGEDLIAIGASEFASRERRTLASGSVHFLDRDYRTLARLDLPAAPTDIRRIDGKDYALSEVAQAYHAKLR